MSNIVWPVGEDFQEGVARLNRLIGGRKDVVAQFYRFTPKDKTEEVKGWRPWRGARVKADFEAEEGQIVQEYKPYGSDRLEHCLLRQLDDKTMELHVRGRELLGVYALDKNAQCNFLAADFDDHEGTLDPEQVWQQVKHFADICETHDFIPNIERSKSGKGYHVWVFFEAAIDADKVRAVGKWLMQEADVIRDGESFDTFDRFFPVQSKIAEGLKGFGNLIAIPMCGKRAYSEGKTAWVDDENQIVDDPFALLEVIESDRLVSLVTVDGFMDEYDIRPEESHYSNGSGENRPKIIGADVLAGVEEGARNDAIFKYACSLRSKNMDIEEARVLVYSAADKSNFDESEAEQCLLSAFKYVNSPKKTNSKSANVDPDSVRHANADFDVDFSSEPADEGTGMPWPNVAPYQLDQKQGLRDGGNVLLCTKPIWVDAVTCDRYDDFGVRIKFYDLNWKLREYVLPRTRMYEQGGVLARELASKGCPIIPGKEKMISRYIVCSEPQVTKRVLATERLGWFDRPKMAPIFMLPSGPIGDTDVEIAYQPKHITNGADRFHISGELDEWRTEVAGRCTGNPMLMFGVLVALAGPLLNYARGQSGGYHMHGTSTSGKTTLLQAAASVWGCGADPQEGPELTSIRTWHTTAAALESMAEIHNDTAICLDEISEANPMDLGQVIYNLAGGISKGRGTADGGLRDMRSWHLMILSTGEKSVKHIITSTGSTPKGGQRVRLTDIPVSAGEHNRGVIITAEGDKAAILSDEIKEASATYFGSAGPAFAAYILATLSKQGASKFSRELRDDVAGIEERLAHTEDGRQDLPPEAKRILRRTALVAVAGIMAEDAGILPWPAGDIIAAVENIRDRWLYELGSDRSETDKALAYFRNEIFKHIDRFKTPGDTARVHDLLGARIKSDVLIFPGQLASLCGEFDQNEILQALKDRGWLKFEKGRLTKKTPTPLSFMSETARPRMHWVVAEFLDSSDHLTQNEFDFNETGAPL